jgi:hypothetical protein
MTVSRLPFAFRSCFILAALVAVFAAGAVSAQDVVTVAAVTAAGTTVDVPISIRDAAGTPLGMDRPAGSKIQSFSIKVTYAPAGAVSSISIARDGITASLTPTSEFKPTTASSVSLLDTFPESTSPIPFTLNAAAPGNRVAHLLVTLSAAATPGTSITLTLDPALTQLTDAGGSAATKETSANGQLQLVDGSITIPTPVLTLTPSTLTVQRFFTESLTAHLSLALTNPTTIALTSSDDSVATVPASIVIPAGATTGSVPVQGVTAGTASITATLPQAIGGTSASSNVHVVVPVEDCIMPTVPQMTAPVASVASGTQYLIAWSLADAATEYLLEESTDENFANATTTTVTAPPSTFTHSGASDTRYYYRVRARNHATGCNFTSAASASVSVLVEASLAPLKRVLPVVGSTHGNFGSFFKTSVQLFNPTDGTVSGNIVYHPADGAADATLAYSLAAGKSIAWDDLLPAMGRSGLGTADIVGDLGSAMVVSSVRVFNDAGADGTTGLNEDAFRVEEALRNGQTGVLIAPADFTRFRLNIGIRTLEQGAVMTIVVRDREGIVLKTLDREFTATHFEQPSSAGFLLGLALTGGESISIHLTSGSAFIYGATTDNKTNDPSIQFARDVN